MAKTRNPNVKKAGEQYEYTPDQVQEVMKCAADPIYFIKKYCFIEHPIEGAVPFDLRPYQDRMIEKFKNNRHVIVLSARQSGKSVTSAAYLLWFAAFNFEKTVLIASNKNDNAKEMIYRIRFIYERLPTWLKPGITDDGWNKHNVGFDNGSRILSQATTENTGRGFAISLLFLDEFAFVRDTIQQEFWTSIAPTLATGGSCIICSTPNGDTNIFAQLWRGAELNTNGFTPIEIKWDEPPDRDEDFKQKEIAKIGETRWLQEYACQFLSSDPLLIDTIVLANLTNATKENKPVAEIQNIKFFKQPIQGMTYLVGVDPATGRGEDFTTIIAYEFPSMEQIAEFRSNTTSTVDAYQTLKRLLRVFEKQQCNVYYSIEANGVGEGMISLLQADEAPVETAEFISESGGKVRTGMFTVKKVKMKACLALKEMVERSTLKVCSPVLTAELKQFVRRGGSYAAKIGATDDLISATLIVIRLLSEIATFDQEAYDKLFSSSYYSEEGWDENDQPLGVVFG